MSSVVRLMRTGPRKLPALPQPSGSSLPSRALPFPARYRQLRAEIPAHDLLIIPQSHCFFKCCALDFCKNRAKTATFFKHLTQKAASKAAFLLIKRPGACTPGFPHWIQKTHGSVYARFFPNNALFSHSGRSPFSADFHPYPRVRCALSRAAPVIQHTPRDLPRPRSHQSANADAGFEQTRRTRPCP